MRRGLGLLLIVALLVGCSSYAPPEAWERDLHARPGMQLNDDPLSLRLTDQVYTSRENSKGGGAARGAGCGCN